MPGIGVDLCSVNSEMGKSSTGFIIFWGEFSSVIIDEVSCTEREILSLGFKDFSNVDLFKMFWLLCWGVDRDYLDLGNKEE